MILIGKIMGWKCSNYAEILNIIMGEQIVKQIIIVQT